jgi:hypothetical protein
MHANDGQGADMRLSDFAYMNVPTGVEPSSLRGTRRLLRDLVCVGRMQDDRLPASVRVDARLGRELAAVVRATIVGPGPAHGLRTRRAA